MTPVHHDCRRRAKRLIDTLGPERGRPGSGQSASGGCPVVLARLGDLCQPARPRAFGCATRGGLPRAASNDGAVGPAEVPTVLRPVSGTVQNSYVHTISRESPGGFCRRSVESAPAAWYVRLEKPQPLPHCL